MGVNAFGTDNFVRFVLRKRMQEIKADDKVAGGEANLAPPAHTIAR